MATNVAFNGTTYSVPAPGDTDDWGTSLSALLIAMASAWTPFDGPPDGPNAVGNFYVGLDGVVMTCTVAGSPGTWVSIGSQT